LVQQLHNQLPGVSRKGLLQLLRLLSGAVASLEASVTADMLQQMLHALENPGSFQPVVQVRQQDSGRQQQQQQQEEEQQQMHGTTTMDLEQTKQQQQQQLEQQVCVTAVKDAAAAKLAEQQQQGVHAMQVDEAAPGLEAAQPQHAVLDTQGHMAETVQRDVHKQQQQQLQHMQQQQQQQQQGAPVHAAALPAINVRGMRTLSGQLAEEEPYSPTRHAAEETAAAATAAAAAAAAATRLVAALASATAKAGATNSQQGQQQQRKHLVGAKRVAAGGEPLQQPHSKKAATVRAVPAASSSKPVVSSTTARRTAADAHSPAASAAAGVASDQGIAAPAAAAPAAGEGSEPKLPGEAYALTLADDLRFSLQQLGSARAVVDTRRGRLVQLRWYLQVHEPLRQRLPSQELALMFLAKFPGEGRGRCRGCRLAC
jgi:hypothetical protein